MKKGILVSHTNTPEQRAAVFMQRTGEGDADAGRKTRRNAGGPKQLSELQVIVRTGAGGADVVPRSITGLTGDQNFVFMSSQLHKHKKHLESSAGTRKPETFVPQEVLQTGPMRQEIEIPNTAKMITGGWRRSEN